MIEGLLWTEKYRPQSLAAVALLDENRRLLTSYIEQGEIPHLLLDGPPGCGKTTVAKIIIRELDCQKLVLNASTERGIDVVREKVRNFCRGALGHRWNIILLDEADAMTPDAQTALRNMMETYAEMSRFILTCNYLHKIIAPIQSRCQLVSLAAPPLNERFRILADVLQAEGIDYEPRIALTYAENCVDLRRMLFLSRRSILVEGQLVEYGISGDGVVSGEDVYGLIRASDWNGLKAIAKDNAADHMALLRELFWAVPDEHVDAAKMRWRIAAAVSSAPAAPDLAVHFLGLCAELMVEGPSF